MHTHTDPSAFPAPATPRREPIMRFFRWQHLPPHLQTTSRPFGELAEQMHAELQPSAERAAGLRKLLEAKDCFVRCAVDEPQVTHSGQEETPR